ncbi:MAG: SpoIIIAH-like family protein [Bacillota bacterium]|nr:SpoIIIAH-like family protein [Bacillota bacterium]
MIISLRSPKRLAYIAVIILLPVIGLVVMDQRIESGVEPTVQIEEQRNPEMAINRDLQQRLTENTLEVVSFFADYRIKRDQVRGERMALLRQIAANPEAELKARDVAELKMIALSERMEKELQAETMIKSCGIEDCAVFIEDSSVTAVVDHLKSEEDSEKISSVISRVIGRKTADIHIVVKNAN